jgi:mycoredoxin
VGMVPPAGELIRGGADPHGRRTVLTTRPAVTTRRGAEHPRPSAVDRGQERLVTDIPVRVYWRPGCGFCASLLRALDRAGLSYERVNIWEDPDAAGFVRSVAGGSETVPTVRVGRVALINPSGRDVLRVVAQEAPAQLPEGYVPPVPGRIARAISELRGFRSGR